MLYAVGLLFRDGKPLSMTGRLSERARRGVDVVGYGIFRERSARRLIKAARSASGLVIMTQATGLGLFEGVTVRVLPSGKVVVANRATNQGQGTRTHAVVDRRRASRWPHRGDRVTIGETAVIAQGVGAFASRQAVNAGCSAQVAGLAVRMQLIALGGDRTAGRCPHTGGVRCLCGSCLGRPADNSRLEFFGVGGERMRAAGCDTVVDAKISPSSALPKSSAICRRSIASTSIC